MPELEVLSALIYDTALDPQAWPAAPTSPPTNPFASTSAIDLRRTAVDPRTRPQPGAPPRDSPSEGQNPRQRRDARAEKDPGINPPSLTGRCCMGAARRCVDASLGVQNLSTDSRPRRPVGGQGRKRTWANGIKFAASQSSLTSSARKRLSAALPARSWPRSPSPTPSTSA